MARIRFDFGSLVIEANLRATPTAAAIAAKLPYEARAATWGEEVYFDVDVRAPREADARAIITPGEIAFWPDGPSIPIGFGRTPISRGDECRLASACNIFADATSDVKALRDVRSGTNIKMSPVN